MAVKWKGMCPAYHKENQTDSTENCWEHCSYTQTGREAKPMRRNVCTRLKALWAGLKTEGDVATFSLGRASFSGRTPVLTHSPCLAPGQQ